MTMAKSGSRLNIFHREFVLRFLYVLAVSLADSDFIQVGAVLALVLFLFRMMKMMLSEQAIKTECTRQDVCLTALPTPLGQVA